MQFASTVIAASNEKNSNLTVKGILHSDDKSAAVIGTQIVYEGDKISGTAVVKISQNEVVFERNGKEWTQKVQP